VLGGSGLFDIRAARNALKLVRGKLNNVIHESMIAPTQYAMHGRRVFAFTDLVLKTPKVLKPYYKSDLKPGIEILNRIQKDIGIHFLTFAESTSS
jgi:hypothetical protein